MKYFETSAKTGMNVGEVFIHAATSCRARIKSSQAEQLHPRSHVVQSQDKEQPS
jgi:fumarate hydratase class II